MTRNHTRSAWNMLRRLVPGSDQKNPTLIHFIPETGRSPERSMAREARRPAQGPLAVRSAAAVAPINSPLDHGGRHLAPGHHAQGFLLDYEKWRAIWRYPAGI